MLMMADWLPSVNEWEHGASERLSGAVHKPRQPRLVHPVTFRSPAGTGLLRRRLLHAPTVGVILVPGPRPRPYALLGGIRMAQPLRIGLVGAGRIVPAHLRAYAALRAAGV